MRFIPLRDKRPILKSKYHWKGTILKNQTAIGLLNGIEGTACLDIDDATVASIVLPKLKDLFPTYNFGIVGTQSGKYHIYFKYFGTTYKSILFLKTPEGKPAGELRLSRYQVYPSTHPQLIFSHKYKIISGLDGIPVLTDQNIEDLLQSLDLSFVKKKERKKRYKEKEEVLVDIRSTLLDITFTYKSYLPTDYDQNNTLMFSMLRGIWKSGQWENRDDIFRKWLSENRFLRIHEAGYYERMWEKNVSNFDPSKIRPSLSLEDLCHKFIKEIDYPMTSKQKLINRVVEKLCYHLRDKYGVFNLSTTSFKSMGWGKTEISRALKYLRKKSKISRISKGYQGVASGYMWTGEEKAGIRSTVQVQSTST